MRDEPQDHTPLEETGMQWDQSKLDLVRKGQKCVPTPGRVDIVTKFDHSNNFAQKLRLKVFFNSRTNCNGPTQVEGKNAMGINEHLFSYNR